MQNNFVEEDEIDLKELFRVIGRYKKSIALFTVLVTLISTIYAFYQPNVYQASSSIQIGSQSKMPNSNDILQDALMGGGGSNDIDTEIAIVKSRFLVLDAMKSVDLATQIWGVDALYRSISLYKDSPFDINLSKGFELLFEIKPINKNFYDLYVSGKNSDGTKISYEGKQKFGDRIKSKYFDLSIRLNNKPIKYSKYKFIIHDKNYFADIVRNKSLSVAQLGKKANIIKVSYNDNVAERAKEFVDALSRAYLKQNIELKTKDATKTLEFIDSQLSTIQKSLQSSEKSIEEFKTKTKTADITLSTEHLSKTLGEYESKVGILDMQVKILQDIYKKVKRGKGLDTLTLVGVGLNNADGMSDLIKQLQDAKIKRTALLREYTYEYPEVKKLTTQIINLRRIIKQSVQNILKGVEQKRKLLISQMSRYQNELKRLPKVQQNYLTLERRFAFNEKFYTYLLQKKTETEIKKAATVSQNRIIDSALLPQKPIKPKRKLIIAVGLILGLILGLVLAFVRNFLDATIKSSEDVEKATNAPIVATIPKYKTKSKDQRELVVLDRPKSSVAESFRTFRTNLQFMIEGDKATVVAVTSTVAAEGKTSTLANLGAVLQMVGKRVIILNFDLRKPTLHTIFNLPNSKGLSAYLSGHAQMNEIIQKTKIENLDIISAGAVPPNPSELISSPKTKGLIDELKNNYDYILLDTPPVGLVTDARVLLTQSDVALYVVKAEYSKKEFIKSINKLYTEKDIKNFGVIINGIKAGEGYGYGYGYGYYEDK